MHGGCFKCHLKQPPRIGSICLSWLFKHHTRSCHYIHRKLRWCVNFEILAGIFFSLQSCTASVSEPGHIWVWILTRIRLSLEICIQKWCVSCFSRFCWLISRCGKASLLKPSATYTVRGVFCLSSKRCQNLLSFKTVCFSYPFPNAATTSGISAASSTSYCLRLQPPGSGIPVGISGGYKVEKLC